MANQRIILVDTGADLSVTLRGTWDRIDGPSQRLGHLSSATGNGFQVKWSQPEDSAAAGYTMTNNRWISQQFTAEIAVASLKFIGAFAQYGAAGTSDHSLACHCWVTNGNTDAVKHTLISNFRGSTSQLFPAGGSMTVMEWNFAVAGAPIIAAGDRLVFEWGAVTHNTHTTGYWSDHQSGYTDATKLMTVEGNDPTGRAYIDLIEATPAAVGRSFVVVAG